MQKTDAKPTITEAAPLPVKGKRKRKSLVDEASTWALDALRKAELSGDKQQIVKANAALVQARKDAVLELQGSRTWEALVQAPAVTEPKVRTGAFYEQAEVERTAAVEEPADTNRALRRNATRRRPRRVRLRAFGGYTQGLQDDAAERRLMTPMERAAFDAQRAKTAPAPVVTVRRRDRRAAARQAAKAVQA